MASRTKFTLKSLLILIAIACVSLAVLDYRVRNQQVGVQHVTELGGRALTRSQVQIDADYLFNIRHTVIGVELPRTILDDDLIESLKNMSHLATVLITDPDMYDEEFLEQMCCLLPDIEVTHNGEAIIDLLLSAPDFKSDI